MSPNELLKRITIDPDIQHGEPCIAGTRTPVYVILEALALGLTATEVLAEYPSITNEDIKACLVFAALLAKEEEVPLATS